MNKKFLGLLFYAFLFFLPFIPVATSLLSLRQSVVLDEKINWQQGMVQTFTLPTVTFQSYEIRIESLESKWEPTIKAKWSLKDQNGEILTTSPAEGEEWAITRPLALYTRTEGQNPKTLEIEFLNSNPEAHEVRLRVAQDRAVLLEKSERMFIVLLALSLGLMLVVRRPFLLTPSR